MKKTSKLLSLLLAAALIIGVTPVMALAENVSFAAGEARATALRNEAWNVLEKVESEMLAEKAAPEEVVKAAYEAALNCELITDVEWKDDNGFQFRVNDMACAYDYRIRNTQHQPVVTDDTIRAIAGEHTTKAINTSSNLNVLLIGPCYSTDSSFTDEYKTRAAAIAEYTGGTVTQLLNSNASATNIVNNFPNNGVVIFDSHGASYNSTSYLCLTTSSGISSSDYSKNWALDFGSGTYGIDGRFIANYISGTLPNSIVWMAICEGMMTNVFGNYLTGAGAGVVYGYSQSVSFTGDYAFEKVFWQNMTNGATVASAISAMKSSCGNYDYRTDPYAYPVVVSATDSYPSNPDSVQTVTSDWVLPTASAEPVAVTSISIPETLEVAAGATSTIALTVNPTNANDYTTAWSSDNTAIATVDS
ncbi:MAG: Ig-like domain-containing protein, partial [Christensenellales bacterium]